ncbi:hypothetical protein K8P10_002690 [Leucobacter sp. Psy1]|uniref:sugar phosphate isomerase/epimerase family protein n=1 Tax=Leucobacter sp. Psy1 TaxID=2875729 RepID=UPI001CD21962|nr:sugar phosphate isomerase/epimerase [Leucobacter sp. Psy1]UBH07179.1 hypothetical protein K8P10_002690 [Leucobacter sp. Psy1]
MSANALRRLSLSPLTLIDVSPPELVVHAAEAGFDSVGIRVFPGGTDTAWPMLGGGTPMMRETLRRLEDTGVQVLDVEVLRLRPEPDLAEGLQILDAAAELGATYVGVNCNDPERSRLIGRVARLCEEAQARNLSIGLEFMIFSELVTLADALSVVEAVDHPAATILLDSLHLQRSGGTWEELAQVPPRLLPYAQLCDGPVEPVLASPEAALLEARTGRLLPGDGDIPVREIVATLDSSASLSVEAPFADAAARPPLERAKAAFRSLHQFVT